MQQQQDPKEKPPLSDEFVPDCDISCPPPGLSIDDELPNLIDDDTKDHPSVTKDHDATQPLQSIIRASIADEWLNLRGDDATQQGFALVEKWLNSNDNDVTQQLSTFDDEWLDPNYYDFRRKRPTNWRDEAEKSPLVSDKMLGEHYAAIRRTRRDGNCFFRSFMFSYLEYILESQDRAEVDRVVACVEQSKKTLQSMGYEDYIFTDFYMLFIEQLECLLQGKETSISHDELLKRSQDGSFSNYLVLFFRYVASGEIRRRSEFFQPFIVENGTLNKFCLDSVESMGEESDHVHMIALSDALGVPIRVVNLDSSSCKAGGINEANHHDVIPGSGSNPVKPIITLLYRPGHYDILYPKRLTLPSY